MGLDDSGDYINHRLKVAGRKYLIPLLEEP
jgi:hypothetical protein